MAQSGYTPIQLYRTTTAGAAPSASDLNPGELAININDADMAIYAENASGAVKRVINNPAGLKYPTADSTAGRVIATDGSGNLSLSQVNLATAVTGTLPATNGGTGQSSYAVGDLVYASTTTALSKLADVATGNALISGGVGVAPAYGKIGLTTHVSGTLPVANGGTGTTTLTGLVLGNGTSAFTTVTAPSGTVVGTTDTQTLTNKRINPRVVAAAATTGNLTINGDTTDLYKAEGLTGAITLLTPSGTPVDGQKLMIRLEDNGTARAITWTTSAGAFRAVGITLPTTTVLGKVTYVGCMYNATDGFWDAIATVTQA